MLSPDTCSGNPHSILIIFGTHLPRLVAALAHMHSNPLRNYMSVCDLPEKDFLLTIPHGTYGMCCDITQYIK